MDPGGAVAVLRRRGTSGRRRPDSRNGTYGLARNSCRGGTSWPRLPKITAVTNFPSDDEGSVWPGPGSTARRWATLARIVISLGAYTGLALLFTRGAWSNPRGAVFLACGNGDCVQGAWFLGWVAFAVAHLWDPLVTTYISPPGHPIGLMWNDAAPLLGILLAPVSLTAGATFAYNVGITGGLALSAWSASMAIRRVTQHPGPAWLGGLVFGFSPWSLGEAWSGHLFLVNLWLIPIFFLLLVEVMGVDRRAGVRSGLLLGLVAAAQLLISQELFADTALLGLLTMIGIAIGTRRTLRVRTALIGRRLIAAAAIFAVIVWLPIAVALFGPGHGLHGRRESPWSDVADLLSIAVPQATQMLSPFGSLTRARMWEGPIGGAVYLGLPLLAIVAWAWYRHRSDPWVRGSALLCALALLLALGPVLRVGGSAVGVPLPWALLLNLPIYGLLLPARIAPFAFLGAAACLALVLDRAWPERLDARLAWPVTVGLAAVVPLLPNGPLPVWVVPVPTYFHSPEVRSLPMGGLVVVAPPPAVNVDAMIWQVESQFRFRLPWAYAIQAGVDSRASVSGPPGALETSLARVAAGRPAGLKPDLTAQVRAELHQWAACAIIVGPMANQDQAVALVASEVGAQPRWVGGVATWMLRPQSTPSQCRVGSRHD